MSRITDNCNMIIALAEITDKKDKLNIADINGGILLGIMDISKSMAIIADALDNEQEKGVQCNKTAQWVRAGQHTVECSNCSSKVSITGSKSMEYCFRCGAKIVKND